MIGLDVPAPGSSVFQSMFFVDDHSIGRFLSVPVASPLGPRNCSQSVAYAEEENKTSERIVTTGETRRMVCPLKCWIVVSVACLDGGLEGGNIACSSILNISQNLAGAQSNGLLVAVRVGVRFTDQSGAIVFCVTAAMYQTA